MNYLTYLLIIMNISFKYCIISICIFKNKYNYYQSINHQDQYIYYQNVIFTSIYKVILLDLFLSIVNIKSSTTNNQLTSSNTIINTKTLVKRIWFSIDCHGLMIQIADKIDTLHYHGIGLTLNNFQINSYDHNHDINIKKDNDEFYIFNDNKVTYNIPIYDHDPWTNMIISIINHISLLSI